MTKLCERPRLELALQARRWHQAQGGKWPTRHDLYWYDRRVEIIARYLQEKRS